MKKKKNENFVDVDDVDVRGGPTVGGLIGPPPLWGDFDVGDLPRWTVSVSDFAVWGVEPQCGGPDIADIAPPTLWAELHRGRGRRRGQIKTNKYLKGLNWNSVFAVFS